MKYGIDIRKIPQKLRELLKEIIYFLCFAGMISIPICFGDSNYYVSKNGFLIVFILSAIISFIFAMKIDFNKYKYYQDNPLEKENRFTMFFACFCFSNLFIFGVACLLSKPISGTVITTNAFVQEDTAPKGRKALAYSGLRPYNRHRLLFIDRRIDRKHIYKHIPDIEIQEDSCVLVEYRKNPIVFHIREVKNLGAMSKQECLAQSYFRQPEN